MTNTPASTSLSLVRDSSEPLADQIVRGVAGRIEERLLRPGARMPSIRQFAQAHGVSPFTVVASYDRLVAQGYLDSRRGAGFFVRERPQPARNLAAPSPSSAATLDVAWLVRNLFRQAPLQFSPGAGVLPADWLDGAAVAKALASLSRQNSAGLLGYGAPQGFLPLRQQLQRKLLEVEIEAAPEHIVTTLGVTQALDLVAREFCRPGDTILVDDPAWFLMFGSFAALGLNVVGVRRLADGPDLEQLAELAARHRPSLFIINSVLHNPTSSSLSAAKAYGLLRLAEQFDFTVVEDDIYADLHPGGATRLAALDGLKRVIYLGGFSKSMAPNLRVGFIATSHERAQRLADRKMLSTLSTSDLGERVVYKILSEGLYRKHLDRVRARLDAARPQALRQLESLGLRLDPAPSAGMFVWVDAARDTNAVAARAMQDELLLAPGSLFSPKQLASTHMRLNVAALQDAGTLRLLERALG
ncbi:PLP-dependent aminotransferase family protein [Massilia sp. 9I]|uniref:aminotransferase-like domain-containing protein n=1 Tax=Massilia sp. 9I TaxID=2653152 RepID=UPI0012F17026|nr:PLP-dependent aminotransferase family protein [Massilia sp. 9I]VXC02405.1 DNA-binding transcriptional regulator, MocR family, contains an aminotransferase domain [Massilia sp. 9I]